MLRRALIDGGARLGARAAAGASVAASCRPLCSLRSARVAPAALFSARPRAALACRRSFATDSTNSTADSTTAASSAASAADAATAVPAAPAVAAPASPAAFTSVIPAGYRLPPAPGARLLKDTRPSTVQLQMGKQGNSLSSIISGKKRGRPRKSQEERAATAAAAAAAPAKQRADKSVPAAPAVSPFQPKAADDFVAAFTNQPLTIDRRNPLPLSRVRKQRARMKPRRVNTSISSHLVAMTQYHSWATRLMVEAVQSLSDEDFDRALPCLFFGSVHGTLAHLVGAERLWLARFQSGEKADTKWAGPLWAVKPEKAGAVWKAFAPDRQELIQAILDNAGALDELAKSLSGTKSVAPLAYRSTSGIPFKETKSMLMLHICNHGTHHRGQLSAGLQALGQKSPSLDLLYWRNDKA